MSPGARAGAGSVRRRMKSEDLLQLARAVPRPIVQPGSSTGSAMRGIASPSEPAGKPACRLRAFAVSTAWKLRHPKTPWLSVLHRAAFRRRVESGSKISSSFRVLSRPSEEPIPALDGWRMPFAPDSGNGGRGCLSTSGKIASGQRWITQRLAAAGQIYPRSRFLSLWASRRRRRALSLMNPSASCWS